MYRKPSKKKELITRTFVYSLMTVGVLVVVSVVVLMVSGYRFDAAKGQVEQGALVQFASIPSSGVVEVDDTALSTKTPTKSAVFPGTHEFVMWKEGYETWRKSLDVKAGSLIWLNYARLVPKDRTTHTVSSFTQVHASSASPSGRYVIVQEDAAVPELQRIDISGSTIKRSTITFPEDSYSEATTPDVTHTFTLGNWDEGGRYLLVEHAYADKKELLVVDTRATASVRNITTSLTISVDKAEFSGTSGNVLYVLSEVTVRKLDLSAGTISRALVADVKDFDLFDTNAFSYTSLVDTERASQTAGVYREGDTAPHVLKTSTDTQNPLHIAVAEYLSQDYAVITHGKTVEVLRGKVASLANGTATLKRIATYELAQEAEKVEFNALQDYALIRAGAWYSSYSIELGLHSQTQLTDGTMAKDLSWLDDMYVYSDTAGSLAIQEIDGANRTVLHRVASGQAVTLTSNDTYLYSLQKVGDAYQLQRMRMIL